MSDWVYLGSLTDPTSRAAGVTFSLGNFNFGAADAQRVAMIAIASNQTFNPAGDNRRVFIDAVQCTYRVQQNSRIAFLNLAVPAGGIQEITVYAGDTVGLPIGCKVWAWSGLTTSVVGTGGGASGSLTNPVIFSNLQLNVGSELFFAVEQDSATSVLSVTAYNGVDTPVVDDNNPTFNAWRYLIGSMASSEGVNTNDLSINGTVSGTKSGISLVLPASVQNAGNMLAMF